MGKTISLCFNGNHYNSLLREEDVRPSYESLIDATVLNFAFSQRFPISFIHTMDSDRSKTEVRDDDLDDDYNPGNNDSSDEENNPFNDYNETEKKSVGKLNLAQLKELLQKES